MLSLTQRDCRLGDKYGGKKLKDEDSRTLKVELEEIILDDVELNMLLGEPHAHHVLYNFGTEPIEPYLKCVKALELKDAWEGAYVELIYELGVRKLVMSPAKISRIRLELRSGGHTAMSCVVEAVPDLRVVDEIIARMGTGIEVVMRAEAPGAQKDLPLNNFGQGEQREVSGGFRPTRTAEEIDAELAARSPNGPTMGDAGWPPPDEGTSQPGAEGDQDPLFDLAVKAVKTVPSVGVSHVQRCLAIGYNRAVRMLEAMEQAGIVGPVQETGLREVLQAEPMSTDEAARIEEGLRREIEARQASPGVIDGKTSRSRARRSRASAGAH